MPLTLEIVCQECGEELETEENDAGQIEVKFCENCRQRLSLESPSEIPGELSICRS